MSTYSIGALARAAQVSIDTIRFYEKIGLLPQPARQPSGYRRYGADDLRRLMFVRNARDLGLSLSEIGELVRLESAPDAPAALQVLRPRLAAIGERMVELQRWRRTLVEWVSRGPLEADTLAPEFAALAEEPFGAIPLVEPVQLCPGDSGGCRCADAASRK